MRIVVTSFIRFEEKIGGAIKNTLSVLTIISKKAKCSSHQIRNIQIEAILPHELRMITSLAKRHKKEFVELTMKKSEKELT